MLIDTDSVADPDPGISERSDSVFLFLFLFLMAGLTENGYFF